MKDKKIEKIKRGIKEKNDQIALSIINLFKDRKSTLFDALAIMEIVKFNVLFNLTMNRMEGAYDEIYLLKSEKEQVKDE